jgi:hypothetical protein
VSERRPDVEIAVALRAAELSFECKPQVDVIPYANAPADVDYESKRENLPRDVAEGVTYRDVSVRWRVAVRLRDPDGGRPGGSV